MQYRRKLLTNQYLPWADQYLDYEQLVKLVEHEPLGDTGSNDLDLSTVGGSIDTDVSWTDQPYDMHPATAEFLSCLNGQLEKILLFVLQEQGRIALELSHCRRQILEAAALCSLKELQTLSQQYHQVGMQILRLVQYLDLNIAGIRTILKKHDKHTRSRKIASLFWKSNDRRQLKFAQFARPLLLQDESLGALVVVLELGLSDLRYLHQQSELLDSNGHDLGPHTDRRTVQKKHLRSRSAASIPKMIMPTPAPSNIARNQSDGATFASLFSSPLAPQTGPDRRIFDVSHAKSIGSLMVDLDNPRQSISFASDLILLRIQAARQRLKQTGDFVHLLAAPMLIDGTGTPENETEDEPSATTPSTIFISSPISNALNLLSSFLYMTNYYIVAPTTGSYCAKLGSDPALAAMIIGMTPLAALFSTVLFSWWTNHSYKSAILFASACSCLGNLCYALGLPSNSMKLVIIGRLLNGFGSARSINRRYIADTFPRQERTAASATFVTAGALGMAAGPAIAAFLNCVTPIEGNTKSLYWQVENAPGWFMMGVWVIYMAATILFFLDPPKKDPTKDIMKSNSRKQLNGEGTPLLSGSKDYYERQDRSAQNSLLGNIPVMVTLYMYFVLKLILEGVLSSSATVTRYYFDWSPTISGIYLACLGLSMLPANLCVSILAKRYDDRELIIGIQVLLLAGCLGVIQYGSYYSLPQYIFASFFVFISTNALEGPNMSLLSKTIPTSWSRGIFNVGLLATEAGTFGRAVSDVVLSAVSSHGIEHLLNRTFSAFSFLSAATLTLCILLFDRLEPVDDDD